MAGEVLTAKQAPHRPGTAPALGLRAGLRCRCHCNQEQTTIAKEIPMWFRSLIPSLKSGSIRKTTHRKRRRLGFEPLEDRSLPSCSVSLVPSAAAPQLVGERVVWTATASDCGTTPVYQFSAALHGGDFHVVRDFSPSNSFAWAPIQEGIYDIKVTVKDGYQASETTSVAVVDEVASRVTGSQAVVAPSLNPLVALYSVPPSS